MGFAGGYSSISFPLIQKEEREWQPNPKERKTVTRKREQGKQLHPQGKREKTASPEKEEETTILLCHTYWKTTWASSTTQKNEEEKEAPPKNNKKKRKKKEESQRTKKILKELSKYGNIQRSSKRQRLRS